MAKRITKIEVNRLGTDYQNAVRVWGERNQVTVRAFIAYEEAKKQYEQQRKKNPVPPSSKASEHARAADLYRRFTGHEAKPLTTVKVRDIPKVALLIGTVDAIEYTTVRDGEKERYRHRFHNADRPLFVVAPDGKGLYLVGGNFEFTERGIVDRNDK